MYKFTIKFRKIPHSISYLSLIWPKCHPQEIVQESKDLKEIIDRLNERLDETFIPAGPVTGDKGIKTCSSVKASMSIAERERIIQITEKMRK